MKKLTARQLKIIGDKTDKIAERINATPEERIDIYTQLFKIFTMYTNNPETFSW